MLNYGKLPHHMIGAVKRYIEEGIGPGSFLTAVFSNDLIEAFSRADHINVQRMKDWADFVYNEAPLECWGSEKTVNAWISKGGLKGIQQQRSDDNA